jgi:hypothetical protein
MMEEEIVIEEPDPTFVESYKKISVIIKERDVSLENIAKVTTISMEVIEDIKELNGDQKKELVKKCIHRLIEKSDLDEDKKGTLYTLLHDFVPDVIAVIISATKGELNVNKALSVAKQILKFLKKCCKK